jgi:hypothetical protein
VRRDRLVASRRRYGLNVQAEAVEAAARKRFGYVVAYAVHQGGALIGCWFKDLYRAANDLEATEHAVCDPTTGAVVPERGEDLLTIVRAVFSADEWRQLTEAGEGE